MRHLKFTLVELLVTIAVIAALAGLLLPAFAKARATAQRASCANNLHGVGVAIKMYLGDNHDYLPVAAQKPSEHLNSDPGIGEALGQNLPSPKLLLCPCDPGKKFFTAEGSSYEYSGMVSGLPKGSEMKMPLMYDYESFHGKAGTNGSVNFLYADGHVGN